MRLRPKHIAKLTPIERHAYAPLIGRVDTYEELRTQFVAQSEDYIEGDEHVLPFPERCKRGVMLFSLCQHLAASKAAVVYDAAVPLNILHVKRKLLALGAYKVYAVPPEHLLACIYANGKNPFQFWRDEKPLSLSGLNQSGQNVLCALEPPLPLIKDTAEMTVRAALLKTPADAEDIASSPDFKAVAHAGLTEVATIGAKSWISRESSTTPSEN